jgi:hypothetical protein
MATVEEVIDGEKRGLKDENEILDKVDYEGKGREETPPLAQTEDTKKFELKQDMEHS